MAAPQRMFACEKCERQFAWNPAMAGKKVRCKCGYVFVPRPIAEPEHTPDEYDLEPDAAPAPKPLAAIAPESPAGPMLQYAHQTPVQEAERELEKSTTYTTWGLLIGLAVLGVGLRVGQMYLPGASAQKTWFVAVMFVGLLILNVFLMFCGVIISARVLGTDFGPVKPAVFKLTGITIIAWTAAGFVTSLDFAQGGVQGPLIALHLLLLIYFAFFYMLFDLDLQEALLTVVIVMALQTMGFCVASGGVKL